LRQATNDIERLFRLPNLDKLVDEILVRLQHLQKAGDCGTIDGVSILRREAFVKTLRVGDAFADAPVQMGTHRNRHNETAADVLLTTLAKSDVDRIEFVNN
jgi:hypothetical protein